VSPQAGPVNYSLIDSLTNPISLRFDPAVRFMPGDSIILDTYGSISDSASFTSFRVTIDNLADIEVLDGNDSSVVMTTAGPVFPWSTNEITINSPADTMYVTASSPDTISANVGQDGVVVQQLHLANSGEQTTAGELLTDISFRFYDNSGAAIPPGAVIKKLALISGQDVVFIQDAIPLSGNQLNCDLTSPLLVQPGLGRMLEVRLDMRSFPLAEGFYITIHDPLAITARDFNAGHRIEIAAGSGSPGFPLKSSTVLFQSPASGVNIAGINMAPPIMMPSQTSVCFMKLIVSHPDTSGDLIDRA